MRVQAAVVVAVLALAANAWAQAPGAEPAPAASPAAAPGATDPIKAILEQETAPAPGSYTYESKGRRDPFVSLQRPVEAERPSVRKAGLEGMLIQEVALRGIVKTTKGLTAMMQGTDGKSYFAQTGQKMADGVITSIDAATVVFRQEVNDPLSVVKSRELKKSLYQSEEARQ